MSTIDQQFIEFVVKSLVSKPDAVEVKRTIDEKGVLLELTVDPEDLGRVIGKRGATAQSIRTLLRALGTKNEARYNLKIIDNGEPKPNRPDRADKPAAAQTSEETPADNEDKSKEASEAQPEASDEADRAEENSDQEEPKKDKKEESGDNKFAGWGDDSDFAKDEPAEKSDSKGEEDGEDSDVVSKTRRELADLDDLDV